MHFPVDVEGMTWLASRQGDAGTPAMTVLDAESAASPTGTLSAASPAGFICSRLQLKRGLFSYFFTTLIKSTKFYIIFNKHQLNLIVDN